MPTPDGADIITITIDLHSTLSQYRRSESGVMDVERGASIADLLTQLASPPELGLTIFIDGQRVSPKTSLHGGEEIKIFPLMGGG